MTTGVSIGICGGMADVLRQVGLGNHNLWLARRRRWADPFPNKGQIASQAYRYFDAYEVRDSICYCWWTLIVLIRCTASRVGAFDLRTTTKRAYKGGKKRPQTRHWVGALVWC